MQDTFKWTRETINEFLDSFPDADLVQLADRMEQFKSSKFPKKEWEIVAFNKDGKVFKLVEDWREKFSAPHFECEDCGEKGFWIHWALGSHAKGVSIHSVRRLSDDWTVSVKDKVKTVSGKIGTIQAINADGHILFSDITGLEHITTIQKLPQPILITSDGVEIYNWKDFQPAIVFPDFSIKINATGDYWVSAKAGYPNSKIFSTRQVAEEYILNNRPLLSLNDVKEAWNKGRSFVGTDWLLEQLTILVKQKLNQ